MVFTKKNYNPNITSTYVLWNGKRGHQLVPLKYIKEAPTQSSLMLYQQNGACMQNGTNIYYVHIKFRLN